ncbi:hypothetical protein Hanom_Chr09g00788611 [Helianthus anomalus]
MASPSIPSSPPSSQVEEDVENVDAGGALPVMPEEYGARYPGEGDTAVDAPTGIITVGAYTVTTA